MNDLSNRMLSLHAYNVGLSRILASFVWDNNCYQWYLLWPSHYHAYDCLSAQQVRAPGSDCPSVGSRCCKLEATLIRRRRVCGCLRLHAVCPTAVAKHGFYYGQRPRVSSPTGLLFCCDINVNVS